MKFKVILLYCVISARPECKLCSVKYSWLFRRSTHRRRWSQYGPLWRPCFEAPVGQFGFPTQPAAKCSSACSRRRRHSPGGNFTLSPNGASPHQALLTPPRCLIPTMPEQTPATISFRENTQGTRQGLHAADHLVHSQLWDSSLFMVKGCPVSVGPAALESMSASLLSRGETSELKYMRLSGEAFRLACQMILEERF